MKLRLGHLSSIATFEISRTTAAANHPRRSPAAWVPEPIIAINVVN
jgi:hypothetical protein